MGSGICPKQHTPPPERPGAISDAERRILAPHSGLAGRDTEMTDEEWIKTLDDGRMVKFVYQALPEGGAFITAQIAGNEVVYSILLPQAKNLLSREDVERRFEAELSKK
jgi:hypothetical protein